MKSLPKIFLFTLFVFTAANAQTNNPDVLLKKVLDSFNNVQDYQVAVKIKVDVEFLKVPDTEARIYFKQPDKIHFESETFALLPREGFDFSPAALLRKKYKAFYEREDTIDNFKTSVVKVIPLGETDDIILSTIWIDQSKNVVRRVETTTKTNGTFAIELKYKQPDMIYPLPSEMIFSFNIDRMNIPPGFSGELTPDTRRKMREMKPQTTGKVYVSYINYQVNTGIPDEFFELKKKK